MAKKKKKQDRPPPIFEEGDTVRVKAGITDPDFPDVLMGGWTGTVKEVRANEIPPLYLIAWSSETLEQLDPSIRSRCEEEGLDIEVVYLSEDDLEFGAGGPVVVERSTLSAKPLDMKDFDDRVRAVFELTSRDKLPEVDEDSLEEYRDYLMTALRFPFDAVYSKESGPFDEDTLEITVLELLPMKFVDDKTGLLCRAESDGESIEVPLCEADVNKRHPNRQLIEDYSHWFWTF